MVIKKQLEETHAGAQPLPTNYTTTPIVMQWLVESQRELGRRSIVMPLAVLTKLQNVIYSLPTVMLTNIEWQSDDQDLLVPTLPPNNPITFRLTLDGVISQSSIDKADDVDHVQGLRQFEVFIASLNNAFGITQPDRVVYPFGADTNNRIRQSGLQSDAEPKPAFNSFSVEISIPEQHLQQDISSLDTLLGELE